VIDRFTFKILRETPPLGFFTVDAHTGRIITHRSLDREHTAMHYLVISAVDASEPLLSSTVNVTVYVADRNDNAPFIEFPSPGNDTLEVKI